MYVCMYVYVYIYNRCQATGHACIYAYLFPAAACGRKQLLIMGIHRWRLLAVSTDTACVTVADIAICGEHLFNYMSRCDIPHMLPRWVVGFQNREGVGAPSRARPSAKLIALRAAAFPRKALGYSCNCLCIYNWARLAVSMRRYSRYPSRLYTIISVRIMTRPGLEPGISGSGGRRLIH